jgi:hypothetical protein
MASVVGFDTSVLVVVPLLVEFETTSPLATTTVSGAAGATAMSATAPSAPGDVMAMVAEPGDTLAVTRPELETETADGSLEDHEIFADVTTTDPFVTSALSFTVAPGRVRTGG